MRGELPAAARSAGGRDPREAARGSPQARPSPLKRLFSKRTRWDRTGNALSRAQGVRRGRGQDLLDLTESNPTRAGIPYPEDLLAALASPSALRYEPSPLGHDAARSAIAADYIRRGIDVHPDRVVVTASTSESYAFAFKLLCDPGDEVLVPTPSYPLFDFLAGLESVAVRPYPIHFAGGEWHVDTSAVADLVTRHTRAIVVVHPNNPTGSFLKKDEAAALVEIAARADLAIVSDEVFLDYGSAPDERRAGTLALTRDSLTFTLGGLSKAGGLPQLKLGWMIVSGPEERRREAEARLEIIADTYLSVSTPVQLAAGALLERSRPVFDAIKARVRDNRRALEGQVAGSPATLLPAEGGWYAVLKVPATRSEESLVVKLAEEEGVSVHPGFFFGFPNEAYLVVSLLCPPQVLSEGMRRLLRVL